MRRPVLSVMDQLRTYGLVVLLFAALTMAVLPNVVSAEDEVGFIVRSADTTLISDVYLLDALIDYRLSEQVLEALRKGVPITVSLDIEVWRDRRYWLSHRVATLQQRYQLQFHALTQQYLVTNLNTGIQSSVPSLSAALDMIGTIIDLPLIDKQLLHNEGNYWGRMRANLDADMLPAPLLILSYVTPGWWLSSDWFTWRL